MDRAIRIVELAIEKHGAPVFVRHEIVHNKFVVDTLKAKGAVFVEELDEVPDGAPVVFSAHGVPKSVPANAIERGLEYLDATCPLVSKVHREAERLVVAGRHIVFIGHHGHPEVIGTFGQVDAGTMTLIETVEDAEAFTPPDPDNLAFLTQTTLSVDDTAATVAVLKRRFPSIHGPKGEDICYATSNRQAAVKAIASGGRRDAGDRPRPIRPTRCGWSRSRSGEGTPARLIQRATDIDWAFLDGVASLGITAGASAPEVLVRELVDRLATRFDVREREVETNRETVAFKLPRGLEAAA